MSQLVHHAIRPIFSFYQLFICFKYSNIVINRHKILASFGMMHLFGTSIAFWIGTIIDDAVDFYTQHHLAENSSNSVDPFDNLKYETLNHSTLMNILASPINASDHDHLTGHNYDNSVPGSAAILAIECIQSVSPSISSSKIFPYMYPFTIEYNVCLAVLWYLVWDNIAKDIDCGDINSNCKSSDAKKHSDAETDANNQKLRQKRRRLSDFHPSLTIEDSKINMDTEPGRNFKEIYEHFDMSDSLNNSRNFRNDPLTRKRDFDAYSDDITIRADCHASNKGLFGGLFILLFMIVTMIMFFISLGSSANVQTLASAHVSDLNVNSTNIQPRISPNIHDVAPKITASAGTVIGSVKDENAVAHASNGISKYIYHIQETLLTTLIFISTMIAYRHVRKFDIVHVKMTSHTTDILLLVVPLIFYFVNNILSIAAEINFKNYFRVTLLVFITVQVIFQAVFIIDASHRRIDKGSRDRFKKPGREFITFSILLNISSWIVYTFQSKAVEPYLNEPAFYGNNFWMIVSHTTLPLMLFYRFHCSVCLADIWKFSYDPPDRD